jgi:hypothetical protein
LRRVTGLRIQDIAGGKGVVEEIETRQEKGGEYLVESDKGALDALRKRGCWQWRIFGNYFFSVLFLYRLLFDLEVLE